MEKENVGKGKERVLCGKFCNRVSKEQNMERKRGKGKERVLHEKFCNRASERVSQKV